MIKALIAFRHELPSLHLERNRSPTVFGSHVGQGEIARILAGKIAGVVVQLQRVQNLLGEGICGDIQRPVRKNIGAVEAFSRQDGQQQRVSACVAGIVAVSDRPAQVPFDLVVQAVDLFADALSRVLKHNDGRYGQITIGSGECTIFRIAGDRRLFLQHPLVAGALRDAGREIDLLRKGGRTDAAVKQGNIVEDILDCRGAVNVFLHLC